MAAKKKKSVAKKRGTRKSDLKRKRQKNARQDTVFMWARRATIAASVVALMFWGAAWFVLSDADTVSVNWVRAKVLSVTANAGFRVEEILVEGRKYSDSAALLALINVQAGDPIFALDPVEAKAQIEKITWVETARVERRLPSTVYVHLQERRPIALWEHDGEVSVIDSQGVALTQQSLDLFKDLLMIRGKGAPEKSRDFITMLEAEKDILPFIDHAQLIDERRWDVLLTDGKRIKLPAKNAFLALRNIMHKHEEDNILSKESITDIDARYAGRLIVRTKLGKVQDYKADIKNVGTPL